MEIEDRVKALELWAEHEGEREGELKTLVSLLEKTMAQILLRVQDLESALDHVEHSVFRRDD